MRCALYFSLLLALCCAGQSIQAALVEEVPFRTAFSAMFSGSQWPAVYSYRAGRNAHITSLNNPIAAEVARFLTTALVRSPPGVTSFNVDDIQYVPDGLLVQYSVVRFPSGVQSGSELNDDQIVERVYVEATTGLQSMYHKSGGPTTESIVVSRAVPRGSSRGRCGTACQYSVGIVVPAIMTVLMSIPVFVSLTSKRRAVFEPDHPLPLVPASQVCCSKHACTLTDGYERMGAGDYSAVQGPHTRGESVMSMPVDFSMSGGVGDINENGGYPRGYGPPVAPAPMPDGEYHAMIAQQALEAETKRREDENRWRKANGLPLLTNLGYSQNKPRVLVVDQKAPAAYQTVDNLLPAVERIVSPSQASVHNAWTGSTGGPQRSELLHVSPTLPQVSPMSGNRRFSGATHVPHSQSGYQPNRLPERGPTSNALETSVSSGSFAGADSVMEDSAVFRQLPGSARGSARGTSISSTPRGEWVESVQPGNAHDFSSLRDTGILHSVVVDGRPVNDVIPLTSLEEKPQRSHPPSSKKSGRNTFPQM